MEIKDVLSAISTVGFPVCVSIFLLWERNKMGQAIVVAIAKQTEILERLERVLESRYVKEDGH